MYTVLDEMACEVLLKTENEKEARAMAYNHQCVLMLNDKVIHDYSCDWQVYMPFKFTSYNEFDHNGLVNCTVLFSPAITINCKPPIIKGKETSCWIKYRPEARPKSKEELESALGMSIESWR